MLNVLDEDNREALRIECVSSFPNTRLVRLADELVYFYAKSRVILKDIAPEMASNSLLDRLNNIELNFGTFNQASRTQNQYVEQFDKNV